MQTENFITANTVEYDFENYALEHGIPETLDPLPYRKTGSVFAGENGDEEPVLKRVRNGAPFWPGGFCYYSPLARAWLLFRSHLASAVVLFIQNGLWPIN